MSYSIKQLREMSNEQIIELHDGVAKSTQVGVNYYLEELRYRENNEFVKKMYNWTVAIGVCTFVVTVATIINIILFIF